MAVSRGTKVEAAGGILLLAGLALTHTLGMLWHLVRVAGSWAAGFVFDPLVWLGVVVGVAGVGLMLVGRAMSRRTQVPAAPSKPELPPKPRAGGAGGKPPAGEEDPDIAAVLKKYGIS